MTSVKIVGVLTAVTLLLAAFTLPAFIMAQDNGEKGEPCLRFTKKGKYIGEEDCNREANDLRVKFRGPATLQFTKDGVPVGPGHEAPKGISGANDFRIKFDSANGVITEFFWTRNGKDIEEVKPPVGANDLHLKAGNVDEAVWTKDGAVLKAVKAPRGANDMHYYFKRFIQADGGVAD
ncbi:MAG: hypothetical protein QXU32_06555 [Nitrososphaerales archaeon]